jgi:hypothetical protein
MNHKLVKTYEVTYEHRTWTTYRVQVQAENLQEAERIATTQRLYGHTATHECIESGEFLDDPVIILSCENLSPEPDLLAQSIDNLEQTLAQLKSLTVRPKTKS